MCAAGNRWPRWCAPVIRYSDQVQADRKNDSTGVISVLRTNHADRTTSWVIL